MKTLSSPGDLATIRGRIALVTPTDTRLWGAMSVQQMLCHLSDSFACSLCERPVSPFRPPRIPLFVYKWLALRAPLKWPKGIPTTPELDQHVGGTPQVDFAADRVALIARLDKFARATGPWPPHPFFGPLTTAEWMRLGYLHVNHHLRQFGR